MRLAIDVLLDYDIPELHDVLLQVEVAAMPDQHIVTEHLTITSPEPLRAFSGNGSIGQRTGAAGIGNFVARYSATIDIERPAVNLATMVAAAPRDLPADVLPYLLPSRYCESEQFEAFVTRNFADTQGGAKIAAMAQWIQNEVDYVSGASDGTTSAIDTFVSRRGVCRDFAHLLAALSRAALIPARLVSVYAPEVDPPDFHAVVEVWLDGAWHLVDATGMANAASMARISIGRDATDIAFMTVFGSATLNEQTVHVSRIE